ncbi:hypothetical protein [Hyphomicrobium sp. 2TAF46]|uniref:hypothetical protein n=1 Tax=Hyphomicrobium sp. 2TAF46 TaxID=3233019 RepID=UPI003F926666
MRSTRNGTMGPINIKIIKHTRGHYTVGHGAKSELFTSRAKAWSRGLELLKKLGNARIVYVDMSEAA